MIIHNYLPVARRQLEALSRDLCTVNPMTEKSYTYDPGLGGTAMCKSSITYLDGDNGVLLYRGYPIEEIAGGDRPLSFVETALLVANGELPDAREAREFEERMSCVVKEADRSRVSNMIAVMLDQHPMDFLHASALIMSGVGNESSRDAYDEALCKYMALIPLMHADFMRAKNGLQPADWDSDAPYTERFYKARFGRDDKESSSILDLLLVLHADHEQNCSTTTARTVASAKAGIRHVVGAAMGALSGPLHGGANEEVVKQLEGMLNTGYGPADLMSQVMNGERRLMGFGHRVYKNFDPRAKIIKAAAEKVASRSEGGDELLGLAMELEKIALQQEYFVSRKLYPNVDFYSGLIYRGLGFALEEYTPLFAIGRMPGWVAQSIEQITDKEQRIVRPQQVYCGSTKRSVVKDF